MARDRYSLLVLDGELPPFPMIADVANDAECVVCTDGVIAHLEPIVTKITAIVGDMDTVVDLERYAELGIEIVRDVSQYSNDFEKALVYLFKHDVHHVLIVGMGGKRLDHTMTNVSVMNRLTSTFDSLVAIDQYGLSYIIAGPLEDHKIEVKENMLVSLTPIVEAMGVTTKNLYYPLVDATMGFGEREGLSNVCTSNEGAYVSLKSGSLLVTIVTNP